MVNGPQEWPLLPQPPAVPVRPVQAPSWQHQQVGLTADDPLRISANFSSERRSGRWAVPPFVVAAPNMSNIRLDFRDAVVQDNVIRLSVEGVMGSLVVIVPDGWAVDTDRLNKGMGSVRNRIGAVPLPGYPVLIVSGSMGMGSFSARHEWGFERWIRRRRLSRTPELLR